MKVKYDGYLNAYSFSKDGQKITLAPLSHSQIHKSKPQKNPNKLICFLLVKNH